MSAKIIEILIKTFGLLSKASARKKVYAQKARQENCQEVSHLLRVISESETIQARRIFNSLRGQIDISDQYVSTIFETEIEEIIGEYSKALGGAHQEENNAIIQVLSQLRAAERHIMSFYSKETKDINVEKEQKYFVCRFCGYINLEIIPELCPICGAAKTGFQEIH